MFTKAGVISSTHKSSFTPTSLAGLQLWYKADSLALSNNDPVSTWADSSGNGHDITAAGGVRPLYKTNIQNGLPSVRFDGTDDVLTGTFTVTYGSAFAVCNFNSGGNFPEYSGLLITEGGLAQSDIFFSGDGSGTTSLYQLSAGNPFFAKIYVNKVNSLNFSPLSTNKLIAGVGGSGSAPVSKTTVSIGNNSSSILRFWNGDVFEIIVYDTALSNTDRGKVEDYLNAKYLLF